MKNEDLRDKLLSSFHDSEYSGIIREYNTGNSGSPVFAVSYKRESRYGLDGVFIVKFGTPAWALAEKKLHGTLDTQSSSSSSTSLIAPFHTHSSVVDGWAAVAYSVAFDSLIETQTLMNILDKASQSEAEAQSQVQKLSSALVDWYKNNGIDRNSEVWPPYKLLVHMLTSKRTDDMLDRLGQNLPFWRPDVPLINVQGLSLLPNPLAYMREEAWRKFDFNPRFPHTLIHGDLHTGNVICLPKSKLAPQIIDFEHSSADGVPFFDFAYLEFDVMRHLLPVESIGDRRQWLTLLDFSMSKIVPEQPHPSWKANLAWKLIEPIRQQIQQLLTTGSGSYESVWWLSTVAVGLNYARKGDEKRSQFERIAGLLYAAYGLKRLLEIHHVDEPFMDQHADALSTVQSLPIRWVTDRISDIHPPAVPPFSHLQGSLPTDGTDEVLDRPVQEIDTTNTGNLASMEDLQPPPLEPDQSMQLSAEEGESTSPLTVEAIFTPPDQSARSHLPTRNNVARSSIEGADVQTLLQSSIERFKAGGTIYQDNCKDTEQALQQVGGLLQTLKQHIDVDNYNVRFSLDNVMDLQEDLRLTVRSFRDYCLPYNTKTISQGDYSKECAAIGNNLEKLLANFLALLEQINADPAT